MTVQDSFARCLEISDDEKEAEKRVRAGEEEIVVVGAALQDEGKDGDGIGRFFEDGWNHQKTIANRVCGDAAESDLPGESAADKAVEKARMRDGRRVLLTDDVEEEVKRRDDQQAPNTSHPKNDFCESHFFSRCLLKAV